MSSIVAIYFNPVGKRYHFDARGITDLEPGDRVVVETSRGRQLGIVSGYVDQEEVEGRACKPIERRATPRDLVLEQHWQAKALNALTECRELAEKQGLRGYKFIKAEYNFDGSQVTILFTTDKKRTEHGNLRRELKSILRTKVELFQIGPRDLAKELDGLGACGMPRCCSRFLTKFNSVSIRMAKVQQVSLTPSEVTGLCGRLRCCLAYEHEQYQEAANGLPKRGKEVVTPYGKGRVMEVRTLAGMIVVDVDGVRYTVEREDIGKTELTNPPPKPVPPETWIPAPPPPEKHEEEDKKASTPTRKRRSRRSRHRPPNKANDVADSKTSQAATPRKKTQRRRPSRRQRPKSTNSREK